MGCVGDSMVGRLPSAQVVILGSSPPSDSCGEPASPSACVSASLSQSVSLVNKLKKKILKKKKQTHLSATREKSRVCANGFFSHHLHAVLPEDQRSSHKNPAPGSKRKNSGGTYSCKRNFHIQSDRKIGHMYLLFYFFLGSKKF